jgi:hypothetical protein
MKKTLLTIDWDFFVPEKPEWDLGHREALFFRTVAWAARANLFGVMKTNGEEANFWDQFPNELVDVESLVVTDSHLWAFNAADAIFAEHVILVDAHHDAWEWDGRKIEAHNWLRAWLEVDPSRSATWVFPDSHGGPRDFGLPGDIGRIEPVAWGKFQATTDRDRIEAVHVCRSSCWTPPWLDGEFVKFVGYAEDVVEVKHVLDQADPWDPMSIRWTKNEEEAVRETARQEKQFRDLMSQRKKS